MTSEKGQPASHTGSEHNKAGDTHTTTREYVKREHGHQQVPGENVGNPLDKADPDNEAKPENASDQNMKQQP